MYKVSLTNQVLICLCLVPLLLTATICALPASSGGQSERVYALGSAANPNDMPLSRSEILAFHRHAASFNGWRRRAICSPRMFQEYDTFLELCRYYCTKDELEEYEKDKRGDFADCEKLFATQLKISIRKLYVDEKEQAELLKNSIYRTQQRTPVGMDYYGITQSSLIGGTLAFMETQEPFVNAKLSLSEHEFDVKFEKSVWKLCTSVNRKLEPVVEAYRMHLDSVLVAHVNQDLLEWARISKLCQIVQTIEPNLFYEAYKTMRESSCSLVDSILSCARISLSL